MAKSHIFSGKEPSRAEKAANRLQLAEMDARRVGIDPGAKPRTIAEKEAKAEKLEQEVKEIEQKRKEEEQKRREEEERKSKWEENKREYARRQPIRDALAGGQSSEIISALYRVVPSEEQDQLDEYDSNELVAIAAIYGNGSMPLSEAIAKYEEQKAKAFEEMARGEYDVNWEEEDLF